MATSIPQLRSMCFFMVSSFLFCQKFGFGFESRGLGSFSSNPWMVSEYDLLADGLSQLLKCPRLESARSAVQERRILKPQKTRSEKGARED
jgi:hypothetical protein